MQLEMQAHRFVGGADAAALSAAAAALCEAEGLAASAVNTQALEAYASGEEDMPAINAVVGGVVANDVLKAVAGKGEPLVNNLFLYSLADGAGWVERAG
jgi:ubiquitin-like 1-activating enzyme E1 A